MNKWKIYRGVNPKTHSNISNKVGCSYGYKKEEVWSHKEELQERFKCITEQEKENERDWERESRQERWRGKLRTRGTEREVVILSFAILTHLPAPHTRFSS